MESVGERLSKERKRKGLSIEEVAAVTKIQPRFIQALEEDRFEILPSSVFTKGFLRAYTAYLGMDPEEILELYQERFGQQAQQRSLVREGSRGTFLEVEALPVGHKKRNRRPLRVLTLLVFLIFLLWMGRYLHGWWQAPRKPGTSKTAPQMVPRGQEGPSASRGGAPGSALPPGGAPRRHAEALPPAGQKTPGTESLVLSAAAQEETWIRVEIDGKERRDLFLRAGQSQNWKANEGFTLTIGNVKGVQIRLNGKAVPLPESRGGVVYGFRIGRELLR